MLHTKRKTNTSRAWSTTSPSLILATGICLLVLIISSIITQNSKEQQAPLLTHIIQNNHLVVGNVAPPGGNNKEVTGHLPMHFRYAPQNQCPAATRNLSSLGARKSDKAKVSREKQMDFANGGYQKIPMGSGIYKWLGPVTTIVAKAQHELGIYGTVAEIGVHYGRFTGVLFNTARDSEKLVVADLFENLQDKNIDASGLGNKKGFIDGIRTYGLTKADLHLIYTGSSEEIPFNWHEKEHFEPFRMISVDGGHTAALTFNDLEIAFCNSLPGAVIILDDIFVVPWPGVTEALFQFTTTGPVEVFPFLWCENKLFFTSDKHYHKKYYEHLMTDKRLKVTPFARQEKRGSYIKNVKYALNDVEYLYCDPKDEISFEESYKLWEQVVY